jgi:alginate O-acetyltransferase complex protein AlgJ
MLKKIYFYFILSSMVIICFVPSINIIQHIKKYDFAKIYNTDIIEKYINYAFYRYFAISLEEDSAIVGNDGFLFLGNRYNSVLYKTQGLYEYKKNEIDAWTDKLKNLQRWYENRGINFVLVIVPNKHSTYTEKLPNWIDKNVTTITDDIMMFAKHKNLNMLDLRKPFSDNKEDKYLYYVTDTHWNPYGASIGYLETIKFINNKYKKEYSTPIFTIHASTRGGGDLANFLKITDLLPPNYDNHFNITFTNNEKICLGNINTATKQLESCSPSENLMYGIDDQPKYTINSKALNDDKLLLLCDSFGFANSQLYSMTFNTIWTFHYNQINGQPLADFIDKQKPNIVIYQIVERQLYDYWVVTSFPEKTEMAAS